MSLTTEQVGASQPYRISALGRLHLRNLVCQLHFGNVDTRAACYRTACFLISKADKEGGFITYDARELAGQLNTSAPSLGSHVKRLVELGLFHPRQEFFVIGIDGKPKKLYRLVLGDRARQLLQHLKDVRRGGPALALAMVDQLAAQDPAWEVV